jgi:hypothetical protein
MVSLRHGWLKNGNSPGDFTKAVRCGAKTRQGTRCKGFAMTNGRCRMHGGGSTGPSTTSGLQRSRLANWKHGAYSAQAKAEERFVRQLLRESKALLLKL